MSDGNYIKVCRSLLDWEWFKNPNTLSVFIYCLLKANWKDGRFEGQVIERGSFVTSVSGMAKEVGISVQSTRTALNHLKSTGELTITTTPKFSVITVNNYNQYQDANKVINKQLTNDQQTTNKQLTTIEERKKGRREEGKKKNTKEPFYPNDEKLDAAFSDYVKMRKEIKAPMTDRAITLAMSNLDKLSGGDNDLSILILEQSILNSWKGLFPLKNNSHTSMIDEWRDA